VGGNGGLAMSADVLQALVPFGLAGLTILAVVIVLQRPKSGPSWLMLTGILVIASVYAFDRLTAAKPIQPAPPAPIPPGPPTGAGLNDVFWFDTLSQADWAGRDIAYTEGLLPHYKSGGGQNLCDGTRLGNVATCWDDRPGGRAPDVDSNVPSDGKVWCAYKNSSVRVSTPPDGRAPPGRIFICARHVPREP
jgi:hypothetical protein